MQDTILSFAQEFFDRMGIALRSSTVIAEEADRGIYRLEIQTDDSKLLIGIHGQTLELLAHLLTRMLEKKLGRTILIHLEVNDYLKQKEERLYRYVDSRIAEVLRSGWEVCLSDLTGYERKKVHAYIQSKNIHNLRSFSVGEKTDRRMHIAYEKTSISSLEEDGIGI